MKLTNQAYQEALKKLTRCVTPKGIYASGGPGGYAAVWARDSMISLMGGALVDDQFKQVFNFSLATLSKNQPTSGQIPNCVGDFNVDRSSDVTFTTIDSSLWYLIGQQVYRQAYQDDSLFKKYKKQIDKVFFWLVCQDTGEDGLPEQHPTSDWQDAFPHKYGHVLSTQALYYQALKFYGKNKEAELVKKTVNGQGRPDMVMFDRSHGYYLPWVWKNHNGDREQQNWFDSLGNLLAIVFGLAEKYQTEKILNYIETAGIDKPFPVKAIFPPIKPNDPEWESYFNECDARDPYRYLNAGIWPYIGGFYVVALIKAGHLKKAEAALEKLTEANRLSKKDEWDFNECLDGQTGQPTGSEWQAWSIGMYIYAYQCVKQKKVLFFG
ncbi:MAG: glycoside hydrolase 100 family protein [bacterium]